MELDSPAREELFEPDLFAGPSPVTPNKPPRAFYLVSSPSRQASRSSGHSSSRSADFVPTISTSQLDSPSRRGSRTPESPRTWVIPDSHYTANTPRPSIPARQSSKTGTFRPQHTSRPSQHSYSLSSIMADAPPTMMPSPPQSVMGDTLKVQTISSDPRESNTNDSPRSSCTREGSFVHVQERQSSNSAQPALDEKDFPAPGEAFGSEDKDEKSRNDHLDSLSKASKLSYASAVRRNTHMEEDDESYPDLDDMGADMVHRAPKPKKNGGIRWVPLNVPFKRRGQTLAVLLHSLCIVLTVSFFCACCANPLLWPLLLVYLLHVLNDKSATDGSLKYRNERVRRSYLWRLFAGYFPAKLHKTHELPPTRKYIFGYHPHGVISHGAWAAFATDALGFSEKFPGITNTLLTLESNFRVPFYRDYLLAMGMRSVSRESIVNILTKGGMDGEGMSRGVTIVVGGARESLEAVPGNLRLVLKERKGFVKIAVRTGSDLVPVLAFGENSLYDQLEKDDHPMVHRLQMFILKVWKFTLPFMHGRGIFNYDVGMMPYRHPLNVVVGAPIKVVQSATVDPAEVDRLHELYVKELEKLWEKYKDEFAADRKEEMQLLS